MLAEERVPNLAVHGQAGQQEAGMLLQERVLSRFGLLDLSKARGREPRRSEQIPADITLPLFSFLFRAFRSFRSYPNPRSRCKVSLAATIATPRRPESPPCCVLTVAGYPRMIAVERGLPSVSRMSPDRGTRHCGHHTGGFCPVIGQQGNRMTRTDTCTPVADPARGSNRKSSKCPEGAHERVGGQDTNSEDSFRSPR